MPGLNPSQLPIWILPNATAGNAASNDSETQVSDGRLNVGDLDGVPSSGSWLHSGLASAIGGI